MSVDANPTNLLAEGPLFILKYTVICEAGALVC
ncbi:hypothetical protein HALO59_100246 [Halomonas sp. 59]|nr:hypothetical protein HALO59_100246 [Halomonas sp. 59]CAD5248548.1 hypothetical protein HALO113_100267 [Halomonas sp. 113]CAD5251814.1 hypothetical protein HALO156_110035 [Halomonas sp. 156]CAD5256989.1 hypothetical protein HALOI3_140109 [Halomonas sp. I3]VXC00587.1 hypothetical protein HALO153_230140 [Halomonas titanicae]